MLNTTTSATSYFSLKSNKTGSSTMNIQQKQCQQIETAIWSNYSCSLKIGCLRTCAVPCRYNSAVSNNTGAGWLTGSKDVSMGEPHRVFLLSWKKKHLEVGSQSQGYIAILQDQSTPAGPLVSVALPTAADVGAYFLHIMPEKQIPTSPLTSVSYLFSLHVVLRSPLPFSVSQQLTLRLYQ